MPLQRETRVEDAAAKLAGRRAAELAAVLASLMLLERVPALHLLAADVAGRYNTPRPSGQMPARHVSSQRVDITELVTADVAHMPHAAVHLLVVQHPADGRSKKFGTLITVEVFHRTEMLLQRSIAVKDFLAGLAGLVGVDIQQVPPQREPGEAATLAKGTHR